MQSARLLELQQLSRKFRATNKLKKPHYPKTVIAAAQAALADGFSLVDLAAVSNISCSQLRRWRDRSSQSQLLAKHSLPAQRLSERPQALDVRELTIASALPPCTRVIVENGRIVFELQTPCF